MPTPGPNLFLRLHKWAHRQDENFLTESLAVVLEQLLILAPAVATRLISQLTGGFLGGSEDEANKITIRTQVTVGDGRPDLQIECPGKRVWIEVKVESGLGAAQLMKYLEILKRESGEKRLVLLTRDPVDFERDAIIEIVECRW